MPTEAEIEAAARVLHSRHDGMRDTYSFDAAHEGVIGAWLDTAEAALTAAERCRDQEVVQATADALVARRREARKQPEHSGAIVCPKCGTYGDALRTKPCQPETGQPDMKAANEEARMLNLEAGRDYECRRIVALIRGLERKRIGYSQAEVIDAILTAIQEDEDA